MRYDIEKLREILVGRQLTYSQLHKLTKYHFPPYGVSVSSIAALMCGLKSGAHSIPKIAVTLGISVDDLRVSKRKRKSKHKPEEQRKAS